MPSGGVNHSKATEVLTLNIVNGDWLENFGGKIGDNVCKGEWESARMYVMLILIIVTGADSSVSSRREAIKSPRVFADAGLCAPSTRTTRGYLLLVEMGVLVRNAVQPTIWTKNSVWRRLLCEMKDGQAN